MKSKNIVKIKWSAGFAYAIGLLVTDGSLSKDGRHIIFTSKDIDLLRIFQKCLGIDYKISKKGSGSNPHKIYGFVQIGDIGFYRFLLSIGLMPNKSKIIAEVMVPRKYFWDFLRGHFDGDGSFYSYWDKRWPSSFMYYLSFASSSKKHIHWLQKEIFDSLPVKGHVTKAANKSCYQLKYAKSESVKILKKMYKIPKSPCLPRKHLKIIETLGIMEQR